MTIAAAADTNERNGAPDGSLRRWFGSLTFAQNYTTGGQTLAPSLFGFSEIVDVRAGLADGGLNVWVWDKANQKLKAFVSSSGAQAASGATGPAADVVQVVVTGR